MRTDSGLELRFHHERGTWFHKLTRRVRGRKQQVEITCTRRTVCEVIRSDYPVSRGDELRSDDQVISQGVAYCSPEDNYDAEEGRQHALLEAVRMLPKGSHDGRALLAAYRSRPGAKPWVLDRNGHRLDTRVTYEPINVHDVYAALR